MDDSSHNLIQSLVKTDQTVLAQYQYHYRKEKLNNINRFSNQIIDAFDPIDSHAWMMYEQVVKHLDLYPMELLVDETFLKRFAEGEEYIPRSHRTVTLNAADYVNAYYPNQPQNGRKHFASHAVKLYEAGVEFNGRLNQELEVYGGERILAGLYFVVESREKGQARTERRLSLKEFLDDPKAKQAKQAVLVLSERVALHTLFLHKNYTRIANSISDQLSPKARKLYVMLQMESNLTLLNKALSVKYGVETRIKTKDLAGWNSFLGTNHTTIRRLKDSFRIHEEITEKTDLDVMIEGDPETKRGQAFTQLNVIYKSKLPQGMATLPAPARKAKEPERVLKRRPPKCLPGSHREGEWARHNIKVLTQYEVDLKKVGRVLPKKDRDRLERYYAIIGQKF